MKHQRNDDEIQTASVIDNVLGQPVPRQPLGQPARNGDGDDDDAEERERAAQARRREARKAERKRAAERAMTGNYPAFVTVDFACALVGGDKPIDPSTYYRGVKSEIYPAPQHVSPGIVRVNTAKLLAKLAAMRD